MLFKVFLHGRWFHLVQMRGNLILISFNCFGSNTINVVFYLIILMIFLSFMLPLINLGILILLNIWKLIGVLYKLIHIRLLNFLFSFIFHVHLLMFVQKIAFPSRFFLIISSSLLGSFRIKILDNSISVVVVSKKLLTPLIRRSRRRSFQFFDKSLIMLQS